MSQVKTHTENHAGSGIDKPIKPSLTEKITEVVKGAFERGPAVPSAGAAEPGKTRGAS